MRDDNNVTPLHGATYDEPPPEDPYAPPQARDHLSEQAVVGAALLSPTSLLELSKLLTATSFHDIRNETIWRALTHLQAEDAGTDIAAVNARLTDTGDLRTAGGTEYLFTCTERAAVPSVAAAKARRIDQLHRQRQAELVGIRYLQKVRQPGADIDELLATLATDVDEARVSLEEPGPTSSWAPVELETVLAGGELDPPPSLMARSDGVLMLYAGTVHTLSGESEAGKTWVAAIAIVQEISTGHDVVFIDFEDRASRVVGRLRTLGATPDSILNHFHYVRPHIGLSIATMPDLAPHLTGATLTVIDGVTEAMTLHGFEINDNGDAARFYALLPRWIADQGPAVVMIDHVVKDKEKQGRHALGAQHKLAGIDGVAYLVKSITPFGRGKRGMSKITVGKDRAGFVREHTKGDNIAIFTLDATNPAGTLATLDPPEDSTNEEGKFRPSALMEKVSIWVQLNPNHSQTSIEKSVHGNARYIREALQALIEEGYIRTQIGERNSIRHFHVKPFPDDRSETSWTPGF